MKKKRVGGCEKKKKITVCQAESEKGRKDPGEGTKMISDAMTRAIWAGEKNT